MYFLKNDEPISHFPSYYRLFLLNVNLKGLRIISKQILYKQHLFQDYFLFMLDSKAEVSINRYFVNKNPVLKSCQYIEQAILQYKI